MNFLKRIILGLLAGSAALSGLCLAGYDFTHYPVDEFDYYTKSLSNGMEMLKYNGYAEYSVKNVDMSEIEKEVKTIGYFKFFKIGYFWQDGVFDDLRNNDLDLSNLAGEELPYPIVEYFVGDYLVVMIYDQLLTTSEKNIIGNYYNYDGIEFSKKGRRYKTKIRVYDKYYQTYDSTKYYNMYKKLLRTSKVTSFQVGQNPLDEYNIRDFSDDIMQIELLNADKLIGIILSLSTTTQLSNKLTSSATQYGESYTKDQYMYESFYEINNAVRYFFRVNGELPSDLGSMFPNFLDTTTINKYNHKIKYFVSDDFCFKIGFIPKSADFKKQYYSYTDSQGYVVAEYCVQ